MELPQAKRGSNRMKRTFLATHYGFRVLLLSTHGSLETSAASILLDIRNSHPPSLQLLYKSVESARRTVVSRLLNFTTHKMVRKMSAELEKAYDEVLGFIEESKPAKVRASFKRKQLKFLKADVKKPKVPFNKGMRRLEARKQRRLEAAVKKQTLGNYCRKLKK